MDNCYFCGGSLDACNESEIVCPWCGEADCWRSPDSDSDSEFDFDADLEDSS